MTETLLEKRIRILEMALRQALLMVVDAIERDLGMPRTAELRRDVDRACTPSIEGV
jgi:hypothetical protein